MDNHVARPLPAPAPGSAFGPSDFHESGGCFRSRPASRYHRAVLDLQNKPPSLSLRTLYPAPMPLRTAWLATGDGHELYLQESGNPDGLPVLVLHGGPGSGCSPLQSRFFDPARYRVICLDQRGAGLSRPRGELALNTTTHLLADLRALRARLQVARWLVVGGSWGATLALAHAIDAPEAVSALLLRGLFLAREQDIARFLDGAAHGIPQAWATYEAQAAEWQCSLIEALHRILTNEPREARDALALHWWRWEQQLAGSDAPELDPQRLAALVARYRVQSHYLRANCWLDQPPLLERCAALRRVPTLLLHGTLDHICAPSGAAALHARLLHSELRWVHGAGHDPTHPGMVDAMVRALDAFAGHGNFGGTGRV